MEIRLEILGWREGDEQHTQQLPPSERTLPAGQADDLESINKRLPSRLKTHAFGLFVSCFMTWQ